MSEDATERAGNGRKNTDRRLDRLEQKVETIERQENGSTVTRRAALAGLTGAGLLGVASRSAQAQSGQWDDTDGDGLLELPNHNGVGISTTKSTSVQTDQLQANTVTTVEGDTFADIQQAIENYNVVILEPQTYTGTTTIHLERGFDDNTGTHTHIFAQGAVLDYQGNGKRAIEFIHPDPDEAVKGYRWEGGTISGPGQSVTDSAAIYIEDMYGCDILPHGVKNAEHGIWVRNMHRWSEYNHFGVLSRNTGPSMSGLDYGIRLDGVAADETTLDGTASFRNTDVTLRCGAAAKKVLWQNHASTHGGEIRISAFLPDDGIGYHIDSSNKLYAIEGNFRVYAEFEFGNENSESVRVDSHRSPLFIMPRLRGAGDRFVESGSGAKGAITDTSFEDLSTGRAFRFTPGSNGRLDNIGSLSLIPTADSNVNWSYDWLQMKGPGDDPQNRDVVNSIGNRNDEFTLRNHAGNGVQCLDSNNDFIRMSASSHRSVGADGARQHLGTYTEHPSAGNGDTWYIDGSGGPSEGFYGQTSGGTIQLG